MTCERRQAGFTLIEVVVVLGVLGLLLGAAMPLASAMIDADRRQEVRKELAAIAAALESYYFDRGSFPAALNTAGFINVYLAPGVNGTAILDGWGGDQNYRYVVAAGPNTATVYSRGENGIDDGVNNEEFKVVVYGAVPGLQKTRQRMRTIVEAIAARIEAGNTVNLTWAALRAAMGLGAEYANDGFGTPFQWNGATLTLRSAGPDRVLGNADDVTT